jgi:hypothetical protein
MKSAQTEAARAFAILDGHPLGGSAFREQAIGREIAAQSERIDGLQSRTPALWRSRFDGCGRDCRASAIASMRSKSGSTTSAPSFGVFAANCELQTISCRAGWSRSTGRINRS